MYCTHGKWKLAESRTYLIPHPPSPCKLKYKLIYWSNDYTKHTLSTVIYQLQLSENDCQFVKKNILNKKKRYMYSQCKITLKEVIICIFYFILKCKNVSKALKMNITIKAGKLMSTDQFDSRRGQNLKMQFRNALLRPEVCSNDYQCAQFISWTFIRHHWVTKRSINRFKCISRWSTWLGISHFRPFNTNFHNLYWRAQRQTKVVYSRQ